MAPHLPEPPHLRREARSKAGKASRQACPVGWEKLSQDRAVLSQDRAGRPQVTVRHEGLAKTTTGGTPMMSRRTTRTTTGGMTRMTRMSRMSRMSRGSSPHRSGSPAAISALSTVACALLPQADPRGAPPSESRHGETWRCRPSNFGFGDAHEIEDVDELDCTLGSAGLRAPR